MGIFNINELFGNRKKKAEEFFKQGDELFLSNKFAEAINYYKKAIKAYNRYFEAYVNMGYALIILEKYDEVIKYCDKALALNPEDASELYFVKAECLKKMDKYSQALQNYVKAVNIRMRTLYLIPMATLLYDMEEYDKALEIFDSLEAVILRIKMIVKKSFFTKERLWKRKAI